MAKTASRTWIVAMEKTSGDVAPFRGGVACLSAVGLRANPEGLLMTSHPETISNPSTGAARINRGTFDGVQ